MRILRLASVAARIVALSVVISPTLASAECAWVLWAQASSKDGYMAFVIAGWPRWEECEKDRAARQAKITLPAGTSGNLLCLPDTVDPRGPKGVK